MFEEKSRKEEETLHKFSFFIRQCIHVSTKHDLFAVVCVQHRDQDVCMCARCLLLKKILKVQRKKLTESSIITVVVVVVKEQSADSIDCVQHTERSKFFVRNAHRKITK